MTIQSKTFNHISYSFASLYILPGPKMSNLNFFFFTSLHKVMLKYADLCVSAEGPVEVSVGFWISSSIKPEIKNGGLNYSWILISPEGDYSIQLLTCIALPNQNLISKGD